MKHIEVVAGIIKDSDNVINYLETQIKKAGVKIWN